MLYSSGMCLKKLGRKERDYNLYMFQKTFLKSAAIKKDFDLRKKSFNKNNEHEMRKSKPICAVL